MTRAKLPLFERVRVGPDNCTVLGNKAKADSPLWTGLDLSRAMPATQSTLMLMVAGAQEAPIDIHLRVPWCHPDDQTGSLDDFDCIYRVRPCAEAGKRWKNRRVERVDFELWDGVWWLAIRYAGHAATLNRHYEQLAKKHAARSNT